MRPITIIIMFLSLIVLGCRSEYVPQSPRPLPTGFTTVAQPADEKALEGGDQILFGDLHVHTTYSVDAMNWNLPAYIGGKGVRPLTEACDFARFCSGVDFFASNDHAESMTPENWKYIREDIRACQAAAGDPANPTLVAFTGFEWTQLADNAETYYGHKNVIFKNIDDAHLPIRPIASRPFPINLRSNIFKLRYAAPVIDPAHGGDYQRLADLLEGMSRMDKCPAGQPTQSLPVGCMELAPTAESLFSKLDEYGFEALVIPHGTTWGLHVPARADWSTQIDEHDSKYQRLIEVYSGHGNAEEWRNWVPERLDAGGNRVCPEPTDDFLPCCWRAGEIMKSRCSGSGAECEKVAEEARRVYLEGDFHGHLNFDVEPDEWLDCGQCRDCFKTPFSHRPGASVQRALTVTGTKGKAYTFGFSAASDTHRAKPGTGYAPLRDQTDFFAARNWLMRGTVQREFINTIQWEFERQASFWYTGGLTGVHASGRDRESVWDALTGKRTYGTSGVRILLWFDLINHPSGKDVFMGSVTFQNEPPKFRVKAVGSPVLLPGCPEALTDALGAEFVSDVCNGQCYHPSGERYDITRIEVVRVRRQLIPDEEIDPLIDDPFRVLACDGGAVCEKEFTDPDYGKDDHPTAYYVRAIETQRPAVNAANLDCRYENGKCVAVNPCRPIPDESNICMGVAEERAWSSPIYLQPIR